MTSPPQGIACNDPQKKRNVFEMKIDIIAAFECLDFVFPKSVVRVEKLDNTVLVGFTVYASYKGIPNSFSYRWAVDPEVHNDAWQEVIVPSIIAKLGNEVANWQVGMQKQEQENVDSDL